MNKIMVGSLLLMIFAVGAIGLLWRTNTQTAPIFETKPQTNVSTIDGKQTVLITAKGGYFPKSTIAQANVPTVLNVMTTGTFDCSSALTVAAVGFRKNLPATGVTSIEIPPQQPGTTIKGVCAMGMYNFAVNFVK